MFICNGALLCWGESTQSHLMGAFQMFLRRQRPVSTAEMNANVLASIIDDLPTPIFVKDDQLRFVVANKACCALMGRNATELIGKSDSDHFGLADAEVFIARDREVLRSGETVVSEEHVAPEGQNAIISQTRKSRHIAADGSILLIGTNSDVSAVKAREEQYRILAEAVPVGIIQLNESNQVIFANGLALTCLGRQTKPETKADVLGCFKQVPQDFPSSTQRFETYTVEPDGNAKCLLVSSTGWLISSVDGAKSALLSFVDITEMARLRQYAEEQSVHMQALMGQTRSSVSTIGESATTLHSGAATLAAQTTQQMANLREITATIHQLTETVHRNSGDSEKANKIASGARESAERGNQISAATALAMRKMTESSKKIEVIVDLINDIAFQTNILALNAAVEAARAGEAGRGFAVVATEVRSLAQRSAKALKDARELIRSSVVQVSEGAQLVDNLSETLNAIAGSSQDAANIATRIASVSQQQAAGILQVAASVTQLQTAATQNAELVQDFTSAVEDVDHSMADLAARLLHKDNTANLKSLKAA
jgi:PAS domain S-box-containing protein